MVVFVVIAGISLMNKEIVVTDKRNLEKLKITSILEARTNAISTSLGNNM